MNDREKLIELLDNFNYELSDYIGNNKFIVIDNHTELADHLIANGVTVQRWIPVTERLPEDGEIVLVCGSRSGVYTAVHNKPGCYRGWHKLNSKNHYCNPTHWMPLPEPPKEE